MGAVTVEEALAADDELLAALERLVPQLSSSAPRRPATSCERIVDSPATTLFVARDAAGTVVGSLTLALFSVPTGMRAWIEDVVVDAGARGAGAGAALVQAALTLAAEAGARTVDLTSRPDREEANRLYRRLGFEQRPPTSIATSSDRSSVSGGPGALEMKHAYGMGSKVPHALGAVGLLVSPSKASEGLVLSGDPLTKCRIPVLGRFALECRA